MPKGVPRLGWAMYLRQARQARKALGLCRYCTATSAPGRTACVQHLAYVAAWKARKRIA